MLWLLLQKQHLITCMCGDPYSALCPLRCNLDIMLIAKVSLLQKSVRRQQAALSRSIAEGRSEGRSRRRLLRKERLVERMRKEREERTKRRQLVKVSLCYTTCTTRALPQRYASALQRLPCTHDAPEADQWHDR